MRLISFTLEVNIDVTNMFTMLDLIDLPYNSKFFVWLGRTSIVLLVTFG